MKNKIYTFLFCMSLLFVGSAYGSVSLSYDADNATSTESIDTAVHGLNDNDEALATEVNIIDGNVTSVDARVTTLEGEILRASDYADLATAISTIGATSATLIIDSSESLSTNATFPSTLSVEINKPGYITIAANSSITLDGPFDAYLGHVFRGTGSANVTGSGSIKAIYPQWFGADGSSDASAVEDAISASISMQIPCYFTEMDFDITGNVDITGTNATLIGEGTLLDGYLNIGTDTIQDMHIKIDGLSFDNDNGYGIVFKNSRYIEISNCKFHDHSRAIYFQEGDTSSNQQCRRVHVHECRFFTPDYAIYSDPKGGGATFSLLADIEFSSNQVYACQITHIYGRGVDGAVISDNILFFPGWGANSTTKCSNIDYDYAGNIIIDGNNLFEAGLESIKIGHFQGVVISNNMIWGPGQRDYTNGSAIKLYDGDTAGNEFCATAINGNTIWRPTKHGIEITGVSGFIGVNSNYLWGPGDASYYTGSGSPGDITHYGCYAANTTQYINVVGNYFHDGTIELLGDDNFYDAHIPVVTSYTANDVTLDVAITHKANIAQTAGTHITNLTDECSWNGRILLVKGHNGNTTLDHNANASNGYMLLKGSANVTLADKNILTFVWTSGTHWEEVSRNF